MFIAVIIGGLIKQMLTQHPYEIGTPVRVARASRGPFYGIVVGHGKYYNVDKGTQYIVYRICTVATGDGQMLTEVPKHKTRWLIAEWAVRRTRHIDVTEINQDLFNDGERLVMRDLLKTWHK